MRSESEKRLSKEKQRRERERDIWMLLGLRSECWSLQLGCTAHLRRDVSHHDTETKLHLTTNNT